MSYKVLLIDDQHESDALQQFILNASLEGVDIEGVGFHKEGVAKLENDRIGYYQAVILDATGYLNESDFVNEKDLNNVGLTHSLKYLERKKGERVIPWFIYSGAPRNIDNNEFEENIKVYQEDYKYGRSNICFYIKTVEHHDKFLIEDIKDEIDKLPTTQTLQRHKEVFSILQFLPNLYKHRRVLIEILNTIETVKDYTPIRKIIESLFQTLADVYILPNGFTKEAGWINGTLRFLAGKHEGFEFDDRTFIHPTICETLYRVLNIVQDGSHSEGRLKYKVDEYSRLHTTGYLYQSVVYALLEIICYFGDLVMKNQDIKENQSRWKDKAVLENSEDWRTGRIVRIAENNWGTFKCDRSQIDISVMPKYMTEYQLVQNQRIKVRVEPNRSGQKLYIQEIIK